MAAEPRRAFRDSAELRRYVYDRSEGRCLLSFSCGKDALASWLALRDDGFTVWPFFLYDVPGLRFVEESLDYYEQAMGVAIARYPSPALYRMLRNYVFQPPERCEAIERLNLPHLSYEDIEVHARAAAGMPEGFLAIGNRAADSIARRVSVQRSGPIGWKRRTFLPVYDWKLDDVIKAITRSAVQLPVDYRWFGRTFDGMQLRFLEPLQRYAPDDYQRVLDWFPLAALELVRGEFA